MIDRKKKNKKSRKHANNRVLYLLLNAKLNSAKQ